MIERSKFGIPNDNAGESGIARILSRQQLIEERRRDLPVLREFERNLVEMIRHVGLTDGIIQDDTELSFGIDYEDERIYREPESERAFDLERLQNGEISVQQYYTKWSDFDELISKNKLIKELEKRKSDYEEVANVFKVPKMEVKSETEQTDNEITMQGATDEY